MGFTLWGLNKLKFPHYKCRYLNNVSSFVSSGRNSFYQARSYRLGSLLTLEWNNDRKSNDRPIWEALPINCWRFRSVSVLKCMDYQLLLVQINDLYKLFWFHVLYLSDVGIYFPAEHSSALSLQYLKSILWHSVIWNVWFKVWHNTVLINVC